MPEQGAKDMPEVALAAIAQASPHLVNVPAAVPVIGRLAKSTAHRGKGGLRPQHLQRVVDVAVAPCEGVLAPAAVEAANAENGGPGSTYTPEQVRKFKAKDFAAMDAAQFAAVQRVLATLGPPAAGS